MKNSDPPISSFLKRLLKRSPLTQGEQQAILSLEGEAKQYRAHVDIVAPGEVVHDSCLVIRGLAGRFDQLRDGERQITSFYIPGDMCDLYSVVAPKATWSITAVSQTTILHIPHAQLRELAIRYPAVAMAFWRDVVVEASTLQKWVANLGRKAAPARLAHVFCEMGTRMEFAELGSRASYDFNATQNQLADAAGITPVHINRTLQQLRGENLLTFQRGRVEILDWEGLASLAEFQPDYLMMHKPEGPWVPHVEMQKTS